MCIKKLICFLINCFENYFYSDERFQLPVLPKGKELILNIKSTWGDSHYVGLNGIEVFTKEGTLAKVKAVFQYFKILFVKFIWFGFCINFIWFDFEF